MGKPELEARVRCIRPLGGDLFIENEVANPVAVLIVYVVFGRIWHGGIVTKSPANTRWKGGKGINGIVVFELIIGGIKNVTGGYHFRRKTLPFF